MVIIGAYQSTNPALRLSSGPQPIVAATNNGTQSRAGFTQTRDDIIRRAGRQVGAFAAGETPDDQTISDFAVALNAMVKAWDGIGIHVWTEMEAILFLQPGQVQYSIGGANFDNCTGADEWSQTTIAAPANEGDTVLDLSSVVGLDDNFNIGIVLASGSIQWTTVIGFLPDTTMIEIATALTDTVSVGANVFFYENKIIRPLRIPRATRYLYAQPGGISNETMMIPYSRQEYMDQPDKQSLGTVTNFFYAPYIGNAQQGPGLFYVWPAPQDVTAGVRFTWNRPIYDFADGESIPDLPQEWINCLTWNLAKQVAPEYDVTPDRWNIINQIATESLDLASGWDKEPQSIFFQVDLQRNG